MTDDNREIAYADDLAAARRNRLAELQSAAAAWEAGPMSNSTPAMMTIICLQSGVDDLQHRLANAGKATNTNDMKKAFATADNTADRAAKAAAIAAWITRIWLDYMQRCAAVEAAPTVEAVRAVSVDFSVHGTMPYTFRDFLNDYLANTLGGVV